MDNGWYITQHRVKQNHVLAPNCGEMLHWSSHKHIDVYTRDLVRNMRKNNINISKVYNISSGFFGTVENVAFTNRSMSTLCGQISRARRTMVLENCRGVRWNRCNRPRVLV